MIPERVYVRVERAGEERFPRLVRFGVERAGHEAVYALAEGILDEGRFYGEREFLVREVDRRVRAALDRGPA